MSNAAYSTEPLSRDEAARVRLSYRAMLALTTLCVLATLLTGVFALPPESLGEAIFLLAVLLLAAIGAFLFVSFTRKTRRDIASGIKIVARGQIAEIVSRTSSNGPRWRVRIGAVWGDDPLLPNASHPLPTLNIGQSAEIAYLPHSLRTLYIRPINATTANRVS
jgi:hypothetical protein